MFVGRVQRAASRNNESKCAETHQLTIQYKSSIEIKKCNGALMEDEERMIDCEVVIDAGLGG